MKHCRLITYIALTLWLAVVRSTIAQRDAASASDDITSPASRADMVERANQFLMSIQKDGALGESRKHAVTSLFVLSMLSSGHTPTDMVSVPAADAVADANLSTSREAGPAMRDAVDWLLENSSPEFLGGAEEPAADHVLASLMLVELLGHAPDDATARIWLARASAAYDYSLKTQDNGVGREFFGGWKPNGQTRVNSRVLTAWYLHLLYAAELRGFDVPRSSPKRAVEFVLASQKMVSRAGPTEFGGFSVDYDGLSVRSATGAGLAVLALFESEDEERIAAAHNWLVRHPPRWHGPNFFEFNYFAVRGLYRTRHLDGGRAFEQYYRRLVRMIKERQDADGSVPYPPGHAKPLLAMGPGYSTAMAALILNVDRGQLPMDR